MKDIKGERNLGAGARKRQEIKQLVSQENESESENENENKKKSERDQKVVHRTVYPQVRVGVVVLIIKRKTKTHSVSVDLAAEAMKRRQRKRDLAVRKETKIVTKIKKDDQEAATDQALLVHNQKVKAQIRSKRSPKAGEQKRKKCDQINQ